MRHREDANAEAKIGYEADEYIIQKFLSVSGQIYPKFKVFTSTQEVLDYRYRM
jgi:hypothetical protein